MTLLNIAQAAESFFPIPGEWILQGGAVAMLGIVAWMVYTGRLVPKSIVKDTIQDVRNERDVWREIALKAIGHTDALIPAAQISTELVRALAEAANATRAHTDPSLADATTRALGGQK